MITDPALLPPMLAVELDTIVFLVVVVVSLLARVFGKKEPEHAEEWIDGDDSETQPQGQEPAPSGQMDWEEQMRRLLQGEPLDQPKPAPIEPIIVPPPIPATSVATPVPAPLQALDAHSGFTTSGTSMSGSMKPAAPAPGSLKSASTHSKPATVEHHLQSGAAKNAIKLLRNPKSARQAIITSVIIGRAKGLS